MKLILGTANFGQEYGIVNQSGKIADSEILKIIELALNSGITKFDTAIGYGDAQKKLGTFIQDPDKKSITTKLGPKDCISSAHIVNAVTKARNDLKVQKLHAVLLHNSQNLQSRNVRIGLLKIFETEQTSNIGISIYNRQQLEESLEFIDIINIFQIPYNILIRDLFSEVELNKLHKMGKSFQVRSVFLQGLLVTSLTNIPEKFLSITPILNEFNSLCKKKGLSPLQTLLLHVKQLDWCDGIIIGVDNKKQLEHIVTAYNSEFKIDFSSFPQLDSWHSDPRNWS